MDSTPEQQETAGHRPTGADHRRGLLKAGDQVQLTDAKGRHSTITLQAGKQYHTHKGSFEHDELIGSPEGVVVKTAGGNEYLVLRPLLSDYVLSMPRGAAVVYPKDAGQIVMMADVFPGARVVEAGVGSGALTCSLLRAVGDDGMVHSYERREDFAEIAGKNIRQFFGSDHPAWQLTVGDLVEKLEDRDVDRVILDMLAPWDCVDAVAEALVPGGVLCCYVATTTQLSRVVETLRTHGSFTEPASWESMVRTWHVEGLAVRPDHRMIGHTGFLVTARRLADGVQAPVRRRRPSKGAYAADYVAEGATPADIEDGEGGAEFNEDGTVNSGVQTAGLPKVRRSLP
jgi:tRNA (adenine57-N1/adenine58-N1)-methyltransferase